jgi:phosphatidylinositol alpha-mannosyltransferase
LFVLYKKTILPFVLRRVDAVLVASDGQAEFLVKQHGVSPTKVKRIVNAVDQSFFQTRETHEPHTPFRILTLSRLTVQKRVDRLVGATEHLSFPAELTVIGDGEDREKLEEQAQALGAAHVRFVGQKAHADIPTYHAWADVFVIPSDREGGMPLNVLEAMAAGLPVVSSDAPGVRDLVDGVGVVVDDPSPTTFAAALEKLHDDVEALSTLSRQSSEFAAQYAWPRAIERVEAIYNEVTA